MQKEVTQHRCRENLKRIDFHTEVSSFSRIFVEFDALMGCTRFEFSLFKLHEYFW